MKANFLIVLLCIFVIGCQPQTESVSKTEVPPTGTVLPTDSQIPTPPDSTVLGFTDSGQYVGRTITFFGLTTTDIDLDGDVDIYFPNYNGPDMLFLNNGSGNFSTSRQSFGNYETHGAAVADLNGDGYPDIFAVNHHAPARVFLNNGAGGFDDSGQSLGLASENPTTVVLGDADQDGDVDAFIVHMRLPNTLWLNDGSGGFTKSKARYGGTFSVAMAMVDVNNDGVLEMILCEHGRPTAILIQDSNGSFIESGETAGNPAGDEIIDSGDIDGDGDIDLALGNINTGVQVWLNQNLTGSFIEGGPIFEPGVKNFRLIDVDLDNDLDMITTNMNNETKLWLNEGEGTFSIADTLFDGVEVLSIAVGKLDGDEDFDVLFGILVSDGDNRLYFNDLLNGE